MMRLEDNTTQALGRVLLVEDDQSIRRVLRFSLWEAGFDIIEVVTGAEALRRWRMMFQRSLSWTWTFPMVLGVLS
jgi:CheY-like chemotaxis protein